MGEHDAAASHHEQQGDDLEDAGPGGSVEGAAETTTHCQLLQKQKIDLTHGVGHRAVAGTPPGRHITVH